MAQRKHGWLGVGLAAAGLWACGVALDQRVSAGASSLDLSLVPTERYNLVRAVDVLVFEQADVTCSTLLAGTGSTVAGEAWNGRLDEGIVRRGSPVPLSKAHARNCELLVSDGDGGLRTNDTFRFVLGKVCAEDLPSGGCKTDARGNKTILVTASYLSDVCNENDQDELTRPGQVLAAGCEEVQVVSGKEVNLDVVLLPWRDPQL